jgi:hypothetical protein
MTLQRGMAQDEHFKEESLRVTFQRGMAQDDTSRRIVQDDISKRNGSG